MILSMAACSSPGDPPPAAPAPFVPTTAEVSGVASRHAIVTLLPTGGVDAPPLEPAVMDQRAKQFLPAVLIAHVGQPVEFRNSEDMPHNVAVTRRESGSEIFNVGTEPHQKYVHTFERVGQFEVKCDIHEGMEATVIVAKGPLTLIAEDDGRFVFSNVAPGSYTVSVTFAGQTVEQTLDVKAPKTSFNLNTR
ncbi:MAG: hypothetical protein RLZZ53_233 [Acidobacteriota bacterium]|jgi:plastocyanin